MDTAGETDGIDIRERERWKRTERFPPFCVMCSIMMTHSVCVDSLQKEADNNNNNNNNITVMGDGTP